MAIITSRAKTLSKANSIAECADIDTKFLTFSLIAAALFDYSIICVIYINKNHTIDTITPLLAIS